MRKIVDALIDLIFPPRCSVCGKNSAQALCGSCIANIQYLNDDVCQICGSPRDKYFNSGVCSDCRKQKPVYQMARSAAIYSGVMKNAIHHYKFNGVKRLSSPLSELLVRSVKSSGIPLQQVDQVIPVPLSAKREAKRGFNQAYELANGISKAFNINIDNSSLKKIKDVRPQFELKRSERFENIKGAFKASKIMEGKGILLVDDIFTTGATACEASRALIDAGARYIYVVTLARAIE
jgi:competence protein ComFC